MTTTTAPDWERVDRAIEWAEKFPKQHDQNSIAEGFNEKALKNRAVLNDDGSLAPCGSQCCIVGYIVMEALHNNELTIETDRCSCGSNSCNTPYSYVSDEDGNREYLTIANRLVGVNLMNIFAADDLDDAKRQYKELRNTHPSHC